MEWVTIFNIVAPRVFELIANARSNNPEQSYEETLRSVGITLDAQATRLLANMAKAVSEGAVPR